MKKLFLIVLLSLVSVNVFSKELEKEYHIEYELICNKDTTYYFLLDKKYNKIVEEIKFDELSVDFKKNRNTLIKFRNYFNEAKELGTFNDYRYFQCDHDIFIDNIRFKIHKRDIYTKPYMDLYGNFVYFYLYTIEIERTAENFGQTELVEYFDMIKSSKYDKFYDELKSLNKKLKKLMTKDKFISKYCGYKSPYDEYDYNVLCALLETPKYNKIADKAAEIVIRYKEIDKIVNKNIEEETRYLNKKYNIKQKRERSIDECTKDLNEHSSFSYERPPMKVSIY